MRVLGDGYSLFYSVWCSNEREFYDMKVSSNFPPDQLSTRAFETI